MAAEAEAAPISSAGNFPSRGTPGPKGQRAVPTLSSSEETRSTPLPPSRRKLCLRSFLLPLQPKPASLGFGLILLLGFSLFGLFVRRMLSLHAASAILAKALYSLLPSVFDHTSILAGSQEKLSAASITWRSSSVVVMAPTPPGTGLIAPTRGRSASKSASPRSFPAASGLVPTSITTCPGRA